VYVHKTYIARIYSWIVHPIEHLPAIATLGAKSPPLKAVYSRSEKSARDLATAGAIMLGLSEPPKAYYDNGPVSTSLDSLLARPDINAVVILLPITVQPAIILKALAAGKHVLSEKPVAPDVATGARLIATYLSEYKPKGLVWRVAENFEAEPGHKAAARAIAEGKIGKVLFFSSKSSGYLDKDSKWYKTPWRTVPNVGSRPFSEDSND
jgi:predicted dehydrogenase